MNIGGRVVRLRLAGPAPSLLLQRVLVCAATVEGTEGISTLVVHLNTLEYELELPCGVAAITGRLSAQIGRSRRHRLNLLPCAKFGVKWAHDDHSACVAGLYQLGAQEVTLTVQLGAHAIGFQVHRTDNVCLCKGEFDFGDVHTREEHDAAALPGQAQRLWSARQRSFPGAKQPSNDGGGPGTIAESFNPTRHRRRHTRRRGGLRRGK